MSRKTGGFREVSVRLGTLDNKDGSATVRFGRTEVACGVVGPVESRNARNTFEGVVVDVSTRANIGLPTSTHRYIDSLVSDLALRSLDSRKYPYTQLCINIEVLSDDGSLIGVVGNAVYLALVDSNLPLLARLVSFSVGFVHGEATVDLDASMESVCSGRLTVFMSMDSSDPFHLIQDTGKVSKDEYKRLNDLLRDSRDVLHQQLVSSTEYSAQKLRFSR